MFSCDTKKVLDILIDLTVNTDDDTWMKVKHCGQEAMFAFQNHYDGKSEVERRKHVSKDDLKRSFYRNKTNFSIKKYVTKMKQTFDVLDNYNSPLHEEDKVGQLLDKIYCPKQRFEN